jgi:hypothetical protein
MIAHKLDLQLTVQSLPITTSSDKSISSGQKSHVENVVMVVNELMNRSMHNYHMIAIRVEIISVKQILKGSR